MKQKQHIIVEGYPDVLKDKIPIHKPTIISIDGIGKINALSHKRTDMFLKLLDKHKIPYTIPKKSTMVRVKYLLSGGSITKSVRGKVHGKDVVYTVEADSDRELFDRMDAAQLELNELGVKYEKVCRWLCESKPIKEEPKSRKKRTKRKTEPNTELKRPGAIVEDHQQEIADLQGNPHKKAIKDSKLVMGGIV